MDIIITILLFLGLFSLYYAIKFKKLMNDKSNRNSFMEKEAERFFFKNNEIDEYWDSQGRDFRKGMALIKNEKTGKYKLIATGRVVETGLR